MNVKMVTPKEEINLIKKAQDGNLWAFEMLVKKYDKRVMSLAMQLLNNVQDAEDVYQEVFTKVYQNINKFQFKSAFFTWLYRIVVNSAISFRNKRKHQQHHSLDEISDLHIHQNWMVDHGPGPDQKTMGKEMEAAVQRSIDQLTMMQRVIFVLRFFQDFKIKDIAKITGRSEGTIKNGLFRSTRKIRKDLGDYLLS